jgi:hypothetical protein
MQTFVNNYWGSPAEEKVFPIAFWKLKQLFAASTIEEVAFRVTDINNTSLVDAEWIVFEEGMETLLSPPNVRPGEFYFVIDEAVFNSIKGAIDVLTNPLNSVIIWGRLGKPAPTGADYTAFVVAVGCTVIVTDIGGEDFTTGFPIPPR